MSQYCDSIAASSPYLNPVQTPRERREAAARERGLSVEACPKCGGLADVEPPVLVRKHGSQWTATMIRCPEPVQEPEPEPLSIQPDTVTIAWEPKPSQLLVHVKYLLQLIPREVRLAVVELVNAEEDILRQMVAQ